MLMDSGKVDSLFTMSGGLRNYVPSEAPMAFLPTRITP